MKYRCFQLRDQCSTKCYSATAYLSLLSLRNRFISQHLMWSCTQVKPTISFQKRNYWRRITSTCQLWVLIYAKVKDQLSVEALSIQLVRNKKLILSLNRLSSIKITHQTNVIGKSQMSFSMIKFEKLRSQQTSFKNCRCRLNHRQMTQFMKLTRLKRTSIEKTTFSVGSTTCLSMKRLTTATWLPSYAVVNCLMKVLAQLAQAIEVRHNS